MSKSQESWTENVLIKIIMQLKDHFLFSACFKYFTNNEDVSGSEEAV